MAPGTTFQPILDIESNPPHPERLVLCSGKHYYTLAEALGKQPADVALVRIEELSPFPRKELEEVLDKYSSADIVWAQEEPENQGAWPFVRPRIEETLRSMSRSDMVLYRGRESCATVATGVSSWHKREAEEIVRQALR
jgi:probable 2-oxoglutarate dehydrogenase E1 component DHKTD1